MARIKRTETNNTVNFVNGKTISHNQFEDLLSFIKDTYSAGDKVNLFALKMVGENLFSNAVFWALNSESKGFDCSTDLLTQIEAIEGIMNHYKLDYSPDLSFTKQSFFDTHDMSITAAMVKRLQNYPHEYGIQGRLDALSAVEQLKKMDKRSKEYKALSADAAEMVSNKHEKTMNVWKKVDKIAEREFEEATISALQDVPETQLYFWVGSLERMFEGLRRSNLGKASIAGIDANERMEKFALENSASAELITKYCGVLLKEADKAVEQSNVQDEISRSVPSSSEEESDSEIARQQYESENGLPHGTIGNGTGDGESIYEGTAEDE